MRLAECSSCTQSALFSTTVVSKIKASKSSSLKMNCHACMPTPTMLAWLYRYWQAIEKQAQLSRRLHMLKNTQFSQRTITSTLDHAHHWYLELGHDLQPNLPSWCSPWTWHAQKHKWSHTWLSLLNKSGNRLATNKSSFQAHHTNTMHAKHQSM